MIRQGDDANGDGTLQDDEVETSETLCNSTADDAPALVDSTPEPEGPNCERGGTRVRTGVDTDRDGTLDEDEVQNVAYVCNTTPFATLVTTANEPPGSNCPQGGVVVYSGMDLDEDGVLAPGEVTGTSYVCTGEVPIAEVVYGDFQLRNAFDQALLVGVKRITGSLIVTPTTALPDLVAPALEEADALYISSSFDSLALPRLARVGLVEIKTTGPFPRFELPALATVTRGITITGASSTASTNPFQLPALTSVGESIQIDVPGPTSLELDSLAQLQGNLAIQTSPLTSIVAPQLATITGELQLSELAQLATLDLRELSSVRTIELRYLPSLQPAQIQLGDLTQVLDGIFVDHLRWTDLSLFASIRSVGHFGALGMGQLTTLDLPLLETASTISISGCSALSSLSGFASLTSAPDLTITYNDNLTSLSGFNQIDAAAKLIIAQNPKLSSVTGFSALASVSGELRISESDITTMNSFPALQHAGALNITQNGDLVSVTGFPALTTAGSVELAHNPKLASMTAFAALESTAAFTLWSAGPITALSLLQLRGNVALRLDVYSLTSIAFPQVTSGMINISASVTNLSGLSGLRNADLTLTSASLTTLALPMLETGRIWMQDATELTTIDLPALRTSELHFDNAPKLATVHVPLVEELTGLRISGAGTSTLRVLEFPKLERVAPFSIQQHPLLERIEMPVLDEISGFHSLFVSAPRLPKCQVTELITRTGFTGSFTLVQPECVVIDRCRLHAPETATIASGASLAVVGRVRVPGVTDVTSGVDASVVMRYQVGGGPRGALPTDAAWSWVDAAPTASWNDATAGALGFDEYRASMTFPVGSHDVAARFSGDGGLTWTTCDLNGSEDGYQVGNAGQVEAQ